jgi:hypothetical protein
MRNAYKILVRNLKVNYHLKDVREYGNKTGCKETRLEVMDWMRSPKGLVFSPCEYNNEPSGNLTS